MNNDINDKNEQREDESLFSKIEKGAKQSNISKFRMIATRIATVLIKIITFIASHWVAILVVTALLLLGAIIKKITTDGDNSLSQVAIANLIKNEEYINIQEASEDDGYYFFIKQDIIDHYLEELNRAYYEGYYTELNPEQDEDDTDEFVYNPESPDVKEAEVNDWFRTQDYQPYLIKMIRAQIASSYPKLGDYIGEGEPDKVRKYVKWRRRSRKNRICSTRNCRNKKN